MVEYASVGQRIKRVNGSRKITGQERFTADLKVPGMLYARPVGSHYAHARIRGVDASRALAIPGVVAVLTADDLPVKRGPNGAPTKLPVAWGEALHVGQIVALVLAESDAAAQDGAAVEDLELADGTIRVKGSPGTSVTLARIAAMSMDFGQKYEPVYGRGASALTDRSPAFAAHLAEVEVDEETGETRVARYVAVQDVGFAINPALVEGQFRGGVAQGIGWALYEGMVYDDDGQLLTATLTDYALPRAAMIPPIETVLLEIPSPHGPFGAKGVGEPPAIPGPAAVANAIRDAAGVRMTELPIRPEKVARRLTRWE